MTPERHPLAGGLSLRKRVYLLMATGIVVPLAVLAVVGWRWARGLDERLLAGRLSAAQTVAAHFDEDLNEDFAILQRTAGAIGQAGPEDVEARRRALRIAIEHLGHREALFVLDSERRVLGEEPSGRAEPGGVAAALVEETIRSGVPRVSGLVDGPRGPVVYELVPIRDWQGTVVGIVGGTFRPQRRDYGAMLAHLRRGRTGFADLVDAEGRVVASSVPSRAGRAGGCLEAVRSKEGSTRRCGDELATVAPLRAATWSVVLRQEAQEALPTEGAAPWALVAGVLFAHFVLASVFAWGAARSVTRPVNVLTAEAERIADGALEEPIPPLGGDEVGRLGESLERMRRSLRELIADVEAANARLEVRVAERTRELEDANVELRAREEIRRALLQKIITAQEDERKRIARELHDETSQSLAVLNMGLEAATDAIASGKTPRLDEVKALAVRTLEDVHRLILDLRPSVLDDLGLLAAIAWYAERTLESRGIAVRCELEELRSRLPPELETVLFRICQECLTNVARHAQATAVLVQVGQDGDAVRIEIEDDGKGFDPPSAAERPGRRPWGLMGIRERAELFGGKVTFDSAPGQGTRVLVWIPIPEPVAGPVEAGPEPVEGPAVSLSNGGEEVT
jgi:signal transduction histidine kinase